MNNRILHILAGMVLLLAGYSADAHGPNVHDNKGLENIKPVETIQHETPVTEHNDAAEKPKNPERGQADNKIIKVNDDDGPGLHSLVGPLGISTITLLFLTATVGFSIRKKPKILMKAHKRLAVAALVSAGLHVILVLLTH